MDEYNILDAELPTMVLRCNNMLVLRSIITGQHIKVLGPVPDSSEVSVPAEVRQRNEKIEQEYIKAFEAIISLMPYEDLIKSSTTRLETDFSERSKSPDIATELPPCKVQRNYCCVLCSYCTQNPRSHLLHQRDVHGVRLSIHSCQYCQYASRYCQKLKRHIKMVHTVGNVQDSVVKIEKPIKEACKNSMVTISKSNELPLSTPKISPKIEQPPKPNIDLPICSKAMTTPQNIVNAKSDPEAFFVLAYKNQLQIQLEYEQRLKNFLKSFNSEANNTQKIIETPKKSIQKPISVQNNHQNMSIKMPHHITEENTEVRNEIDKSRIYSCRKCNYITHIKSRYNKHVKYHSMPMIQCDKCEFRTTYKWNLTRHLRSHHGNGIYKCSVCTFSANMKQSLTSHEANHHSPPVGRAGGNKPIRRRRCRVGGSDLQPQGSEQKNSLNLGNSSSALSNLSTVSFMQDIKESGEVMYNSNTSSSNKNEPIEFQKNFEHSVNMDLSDSEHSDFESSDSSDMELISFEDSTTVNHMKLINPPIHVDADFLSDNLQNHSFQENSLPVVHNSSASSLQDREITLSDQHSSKQYIGYVSESSLSVSTISAEEVFHSNSKLTTYTSPQSSCSSDDSNKLNSSSSIISDDSLNEINIKETFP